MKKYIGLIFPLILPYVFLLGMGGILFFDGKIIDEVFGNFPNFILLVIGIFLLALIATIVTATLAVVRKWDGREIAKANMIVKLLQIPAYILIFAEGVYFSLSMMLLTPVAGMLFVLFDCAVVFMTGVIGAVAAAGCCREYGLDKKFAIILGIGQFIFCVDVVCAVLVFLSAGKSRS
ncbi:MAG: hypothetical protein IJO83_04830 [Clostridia bacterium]|nr:hypothetical protein [Clostridia bacterium]